MHPAASKKVCEIPSQRLGSPIHQTKLRALLFSGNYEAHHHSIAVSKGSLNRWDRYHIISQLAVYTTYIPLTYCQLGDYLSPIPPIKGTRKLHWIIPKKSSLRLRPFFFSNWEGFPWPRISFINSEPQIRLDFPPNDGGLVVRESGKPNKNGRKNSGFWDVYPDVQCMEYLPAYGLNLW